VNWLLMQNVVLVLLLTLLAIIGQAWLFRRVGRDKLRGNHEVAGFVYAVVGSIFAVNVALAVDTVHDEFVSGSRASMQEAIHLAAVHRMAGWLEPEHRDRIRGAVVVYTKAVVEKEWGDWSKASAGSNEAAKDYGRIWESLKDVDPKTAGQQAAYAEIISRTNNIDVARQARLHSGVLRPPMGIQALQWLGGIITVGFGFFFTMENRRAHMIMLVAISLLVWGNLVLLDTIRFPFNGFYFLEPTPYLHILGRVAQ